MYLYKPFKRGMLFNLEAGEPDDWTYFTLNDPGNAKFGCCLRAEVVWEPLVPPASPDMDNGLHNNNSNFFFSNQHESNVEMK